MTQETSSSKPVEKSLFFEVKKSQIPMNVETDKKVGKKTIVTWGKDNLYPQWLNQLFINNPLHSGIIRSKVTYMTSGGLAYDGDENDELDQAAWKSFFMNSKSDYTLDEIVDKLALDYEISNKFILFGRWSRDYLRVEHLEVIDYELGRKILDSDVLVVSEDWTDKHQRLKYYNTLDLNVKSDRSLQTPTNREFYIEYQESPKQHNFRDAKTIVSHSTYPSPPYSGGITSIVTGIEIGEYQNSEIMSGFSLGTIINLNNGEPKNEDDKRKLEKGLKGAATGANGAGGTWVLFNNGRDRAATVENLSGNDLNNRYIELNKDTQKNTLRAHSVTAPILFGFKEEGALGNATELLNAYSIMKKNYFKARKKPIEWVLNYIGKKCNGLKGKIYLQEVDLELPEQTPTEPNVVINTAQSSFNEESDKFAEKRLFAHLENSGRDRDSLKFLFSHDVQDLEHINDQDCIEAFKRESFNNLTGIYDLQILDLIEQGTDFDGIREAIKIKARTLAIIYQRLIKDGYVTKEGELTTEGLRALAEDDIERMEIVYTYEVRSGMGAEVIDTTRDFCRTLIGLNRAYTKEELDRISNIEGRNVFMFKGGWYHDPKKNKTFPFCRHTWKQNVIFNG